MIKFSSAFIFLFLLSSCFHNNNQANFDPLKNNIGSKVTVKPKVIVESAYEGFYINEKLQAELNKIEFASSRYLKGNKDCLTLIRINISGSIDYHQLIQTLRKRTYDIGGNAIGVYDYQERRRVLVNQHGYEIEKDEKTNYFFKPKEFKYVLVKDNQKLAKITADIFKCKQKVS